MFDKCNWQIRLLMKVRVKSMFNKTAQWLVRSLFDKKITIIIIKISSSSCHAISTNIPDPFLPSFSIVHCFQLVFRATSRIGTELSYVGSIWSFCLSSSMWRGMSLMSLSLLLQQSPVCLVCLTCIVFMILFTQPLRSGRIWHKVNFLSGV